jgi:hypothetical protein
MSYERYSTDAIRERHGKHCTGETFLHSMDWYDETKAQATVCV